LNKKSIHTNKTKKRLHLFLILFFSLILLNPVLSVTINASFSYCREINITNPVASSLEQIPIPVMFNTSILTNSATTNGSDLQITNATDCASTDSSYISYPYEVDFYNESRTEINATLWLNAQNWTSGQTRTFTILYGCAACADTSNKTGVWNDGYLGVYHFKEENINVTDSTINAKDSNKLGTIITNTTAKSPCVYGNCWFFANAVASTAANLTLNLSASVTNRTYEVLMYPNEQMNTSVSTRYIIDCSPHNTADFINDITVQNTLPSSGAYNADLDLLNNMWYYRAVSFNYGSDNYSTYVNGSHLHNDTSARAPSSCNWLHFGAYLGNNYGANSWIDEFRVSSVIRNQSYISASGSKWNTYIGTEETGASTPTINVNASSTSTDGGIQFNETTTSVNYGVYVQDFAVTNTTIRIYRNSVLYYNISNTTSSNFTIGFTNLSAGTYQANATAYNGSTWINTSSTYTFYIIYVNVTINTPTNTTITRLAQINYTYNFTPDVLVMKHYNISLLNDDYSFNRTIVSNVSGASNTSYLWDTLLNNISLLGNYFLRVNATDSATHATSSYLDINITRNALLNISSYFAVGNSSISNFTINITETATTDYDYQNSDVTTNSTSHNIKQNTNYTIFFTAPGYADTNTSIISTNDTYQNISIYSYTNNSVYITIYDANTLDLLNTTNVTIKFTGDVITTNVTDEGTLYKDGLKDGNWTLKFTATGYGTKYYYLYVTNNSYQTLDAYMTSDNESVIFTIIDSITSLAIENATFIAELYNGTGYVVTDTLTSDISGKTQIYYLEGEKYRFTTTANNYQSKVFILNPILFNSYTISLDRNTTSWAPTDYSDVSITYYPKLFYNNQTNSFYFLIISPLGKLINYTINLTYPGGHNESTGNNAQGESFNLSLNITSAVLRDRVNLTYSYLPTIGGFKQFNYSYEIIGVGESNQTISHLLIEDYGLGIFEKGLLVTLVLVLLVGFSFILGGLGASLMVGGLVIAGAVFIGFLPVWSVLITILIGVMIIVRSGTGGNT